jgi:hypothetical protein
MFELFSGFLKYFPGVHRQIAKSQQEIIDFIAHHVEKHRATLEPSAPRDFIDTYLLRMEKVNPALMREGMGESEEWGCGQRKRWEGTEDGEERKKQSGGDAEYLENKEQRKGG